MSQHIIHRLPKRRQIHPRHSCLHLNIDVRCGEVGVRCSRSISEEDLLRLQKQILEHAEHGAVTYTAAISKGEQRIARAVREAGWPLVVLLMDGFPPEGSENEKYYKPGGVYFDTCLNGKLLLLEACLETYNDPRLIG